MLKKFFFLCISNLGNTSGMQFGLRNSIHIFKVGRGKSIFTNDAYNFNFRAISYHGKFLFSIFKIRDLVDYAY